MPHYADRDFIAENRRWLELRLSWQSAEGYLSASEGIVEAAREWLCECFGDQIDEIETASADTIAREIERLWDGGAKGFILWRYDDLNG